MRIIAASASNEGFRLGLIATAYGFGLRHGIDWDHIAAIADVTSGEHRPRRALLFATLYALGHALVVFVLGSLAIVFSEQLPASVDGVMERVVGLTLLVLGLYVIYGLVRHGRDFRMRSRWMLVGAAARRGVRWLRRRRLAPPAPVVIEHDHEHDAAELHAEKHVGAVVAGTGAELGRHRHWHRHEGTLPQDPFTEYGKRTAFGVGMIHGIGAETPTQMLIFLTAAGAGGEAVGVLLLVCFIAGLVTSNSLIALAAAAGFLRASANFGIYAVVSIVIAAFSLAMGALFVFGGGELLPAIFSG